jgi:branched-chain amino acid transport system ATP-binding protein
MTAILRIESVMLRFGGVQALAGVDLDVSAGEVVGLIGPNGSGKTTLVNIMSGIYRPDCGRVLLQSTPIHGLGQHRVARLGLTRTFQNLRLFPTLSAIQNVVAGDTSKGVTFGLSLLRPRRAREREADRRRRAAAILDSLGFRGQREVRVASLSYGDQRRVEIARALVASPSVLVLDEPTAGIAESDLDAVIGLIEETRAQGTAMLLVEHNLGVVRQACDRVAVLDAGLVIAEGSPEEVLEHPEVKMCVGADR